MAALEGHCGQTDDAMCSDHERTEALFKKLADDDKVSSEPAGLVAALADLDLRLSGKQVVEVTREILGLTEEYFSKDAFLLLIKRLRQLRSEQLDDDNESTDAGSSKHSSGSTSRASCATGDARDNWVFEPRVDLENLTAHSRVSAEAVFAKVVQLSKSNPTNVDRELG